MKAVLWELDWGLEPSVNPFTKRRGDGKFQTEANLLSFRFFGCEQRNHGDAQRRRTGLTRPKENSGT